LRELRPVSFRFRKGTDAKHVRYGFIADEVGAVLPSLLRPIGEAPGLDGDDPEFAAAQASRPQFLGENVPAQGIVLQDMIALLVAQAKTHQSRLDTQDARLEQRDSDVLKLAEQVRALEAELLEARAELRELRPFREAVDDLRRDVRELQRRLPAG
jgi:hypothetical protein